MGQFFTTAWVTVPIVGSNAIPFPLEGYTLIINPEPIPGCMDDSACNFNAEATEDDGSCTYPEPLLIATAIVCTIPTETEFAMTLKDAWT